jgi:hypothetical protein
VSAVGVCPSAGLVHYSADGGAGSVGGSARYDRMDWVGQAVVRHGLSALGFRRSDDLHEAAGDRAAALRLFLGECAAGLSSVIGWWFQGLGCPPRPSRMRRTLGRDAGTDVFVC